MLRGTDYGRRTSEIPSAKPSLVASVIATSVAFSPSKKQRGCWLALEDPYLLIIETCIATGARISEVLGLQWKHLDLDAGTIKIEQRVWHQDIGRPKSEDSKRTLGIGDLVERYRAQANGTLDC
jgi:hypothetical protein